MALAKLLLLLFYIIPNNYIKKIGYIIFFLNFPTSRYFPRNLNSTLSEEILTDSPIILIFF